MTKKWFGKAIRKKPPYTLRGWKKDKDAAARRRCALASRPKGWTPRRRNRSAGQALIALANVTKDRKTREVARKDAQFFFAKVKKMAKREKRR